jgi:serine/threonine protein kinase
LRDQGWKLHISATILSAPVVLDRVLPILLSSGVSFKIVENLACLNELNEGLGGLSQVGKFITVYPAGDAQAVSLAVDLDQATTGLSGPRVPSDHPLRQGSLVHYRYGGFTDLSFTDTLGQDIPALRDPSGKLVPDPREPSYKQPDWVTDPFAAAGVVEPSVAPPTTLFKSYRILEVLHQSAKGGVYLAIDPYALPPRPIVIKEGKRDMMTDACGRDTPDRLRHQYLLLCQLSPDPALPEAYELFEYYGNSYLVMEHLEGLTLQSRILKSLRYGNHISAETLRSLGSGIASVLNRLHEQGVIFRDLTPGNLMITEAERIYLIDFELAHRLDDSRPAYSWGTRGFVSPHQAQQRPPTITDDIYGLGATLYFAATGSPTSFLTEDDTVRRRALNLLNPSLPHDLSDSIVACMSSDGSIRPKTAVEAGKLFSCRQTQQATGANPDGGFEITNSRYLALAKAAGDFLLNTAERQGNGMCWVSNASIQPELSVPSALPPGRTYRRYLHTGIAGIGVFLSDLAAFTGDDRYIEGALGAANWLLNPENITEKLPGLYFGEAGTAVFMYRLWQVTGESKFLEAAVGIAVTLTPQLTRIPDLTHGWAGIGLLHLKLASVEGLGHHLSLAQAFGDALADSSVPMEMGIAWPQPPGPNKGLSGASLTGFAHGAAGIAYFLVELWRATRDDKYYRLAKHSAEWLMSLAEPCLPDTSGLSWPISNEDADRWFHWCHGAAGIGLFLLRMWSLTGDAIYRNAVVAAARSVAVAGRRGGCTLCHGLAGNGDFLVEASLVLQNSMWLEKAAEIAELLTIYAKPHGGGISWPGDDPDIITTDYMMGSAGVGAFMLRMSAPELVDSPLLLPLSWRDPKMIR